MENTLYEIENCDTTFSIRLPQRPYPGLRPFEKEEWPIFFGREAMGDAVVAQLIEKRLLVIHGDSGCGKSSLMRAAVLPRLEQDNARGGIRWHTYVMTPGQSPLHNLARALAGTSAGVERVLEIRRLLNLGRDAPHALAALMREHDSDCICIVFDQFEELFAHARRYGPEDAQILIIFLVSLFENPPEGLYAAITMRSEFIGACARFSGFAEVVNSTQYLLPRMQHSDLIRAIREPATLYGGEIAWQLAERLISDAGDSQDQLPLIQHSLMLLYRDKQKSDLDGWRLDISDYSYHGGLALQLSNHADLIVQEASNKHLQADKDAHAMEEIFRAITEINADGHAIRRPETLGRLSKVVGIEVAKLRSIIDMLRADGHSLLRPHGDALIAENDLVDISHEALIRSWDKLSNPINGWLNHEFRDGLVWRALLVQTEAFERNSSNLLAPTTTNERESWIRGRNPDWAERYGGGWNRVGNLITASAADRDKEQETLKRSDQLRFFLTTALIACILISGLIVIVSLKRAQEVIVRAAFEKNRLLTMAEDTVSTEREKVAAAQAQNDALQGIVSEQSAIVINIASEQKANAEVLREVGGKLKKAACDSVVALGPGEGFMWLGNEKTSNVRTQNDPVKAHDVREGFPYESTQRVKLRNTPTGCISTRELGVINKGAKLLVLSAPVQVPNSVGVSQYWARVRVDELQNAPQTKNKVFLQYADGTDQSRNLLVDQLRNANFEMAAPEILPAAAGLSEVRYCHDIDYEAAGRLKEEVEVLRKRIPVRILPITDTAQCSKVTNPGTLELWLGKI